MITNDEKELLIFDRFVINKELPKYKSKKRRDPHVKSMKRSISFAMDEAESHDSDEEDMESEMMMVDANLDELEDMSYQDYVNSRRNGSIRGRLQESFDKYKSRTIAYIKDYLIRRKKQKREVLTLKEYFNLIHTPKMDLDAYSKAIEEFRTIFESAHKHGQIALKEKLSADIKRTKAELQLISLNLKKYISEEQMINAYIKLKDKRKIDLIWLHNFSRIIPQKILTLKEELDQLGIFDNYVILTYVNSKVEVKIETAEEVAIRRDPILFGVRIDSRKLYYVGDWIDEYCDLTLESLIKELGDKAISANDLSVNLYK